MALEDLGRARRAIDVGNCQGCSVLLLFTISVDLEHIFLLLTSEV